MIMFIDKKKVSKLLVIIVFNMQFNRKVNKYKDTNIIL